MQRRNLLKVPVIGALTLYAFTLYAFTLDIGKIIIIGQLLILGQLKVTVQGQYRVN